MLRDIVHRNSLSRQRVLCAAGAGGYHPGTTGAVAKIDCATWHQGGGEDLHSVQHAEGLSCPWSRSSRRHPDSAESLLASLTPSARHPMSMSENRAKSSRNKIAFAYSAGIAAFIAIFGSLSLLVVFLLHLK
jgi:hypothetical protein